jgi:hypothetical protein
VFHNTQIMHGLHEYVSKDEHGIILLFHSLDISHITLKWMDVASIMHGLFECVSQVEHGILQLVYLDGHVSYFFKIDGACFTFYGISIRSKLQLCFTNN